MDKERITVTFNGEADFIQEIMPEVLKDKSIAKLSAESPLMILLLPVFGSAVWDALAKYSRMQEVVKVMVENKEEE